MHLLVINSGSSSIKFAMYTETKGELQPLYEGELSGIGGGEAKLEFAGADGQDLASKVGEVKAASMEEAVATVERAVGMAGMPGADAVGYRVVHPGAKLKGHQRLTPAVMRELKDAVAFAPLHDPAAIEIIEEMMRRLPDVPHIACFDTVFHETMPEEAYVYPLPAEVRAKGVRRYGFHGLSCESIVVQMRAARNVAFPRSMVIAHLGSGCSVTACVEGKSVDTTMGLTPTGGVVMGTRPGDLDPGVVLYLLRQPGAAVDSVETLLNHESGLKGLGGANDMRSLRSAAATGDERAKLAMAVFTRSVAKEIASFIALYGASVVVFTGGIGEHDADSRAEIAHGVSRMGVALDMALNKSKRKNAVQRISEEGSRVEIYVVAAEEDLMIARHVAAMAGESA